MTGQHDGDTAGLGFDRDPAEQLQIQLEQQAAISEIGMRALSGNDLAALMDVAVEQVSRTLRVECSALLEFDEASQSMLLRAGVGWGEAAASTPPNGIDSPAGYTYLQGEPVIVDDIHEEARFPLPPLLAKRGVVSCLLVVVRRPNAKFGVLGSYSTRRRQFSRHDIYFVQAVANVLGEAIERKQAEEAQAHLAAIVESSYDAVFRKTLDGVITSWNVAAERMYGYKPEEMIGRSVLTLFPPELKHTLEEIMDAVRNGRQPGVGETVRVRKNGERIPISLTVSPIRDRSGKVIAASTIARDISDQKRAEDALRRAHEELEARIDERTRELQDVIRELESFAYAVSHDLRAPLRGIDGFARALLEDYGGSLDDIAKHYLNRIVAGTKRMGELIDDLLDLSRLSHSPLRVEKVDLSEIAQRTARELCERDPDRQASFEIAANLLVTGDGHLLGIAMTNLIDNAWKFTADRQAARIQVGSDKIGGETVYFVRDNGIGFDMQYADRLFVPFQRLHSNEVEGTGIGLATVQRVVHRHGGRLWAEGVPGDGAAFYFTLGDVQGGNKTSARL